MDDAQFDVVIAGRGVVAQAAALALAQADLRVALVGVEARPPTPQMQAAPFDNRVFALNAASRALLDSVRVWGALPPERVQPVERMNVLAGAEPLSFDAYSAACPALAWIVEARELQRALTTAVAFQSRITVFNEAIISIAQQASVTLSTHKIISAKLGLLADPALARGHAAQAFSWDDVDYACSALVGTVRTELPHRGAAWQWFEKAADAPAGVQALLPLPAPLPPPPPTENPQSGNFMSLVWSSPRSVFFTGGEGLGEELTALSGGALGKISAEPGLALWPLKRSLAQKTVAGSWVLVGDAAHSIHPLAGLGLNLGLQDVQALASTLAAREAFRPLDDARLLGRYVRARATQVNAVAAFTHAVWQSHTSDADWLRSGAVTKLRSASVKGIDSLSFIKRELIQYAQGTGFFF
jgi:2-polyprenylphenol 6-hydroxylase